jgi:hypothetical protein
MFKSLNKNKPNSGMKITLFAQIFQKIKRDSFNKLAEKFESNKNSRGNDAAGLTKDQEKH